MIVLERRLRSRWARAAVYLIGVTLLVIACVGCSRPSSHPSPNKESMSKRDINVVLRRHDRELMAIPGVVGVYVGLLEDEKTPCLKVMVVRKTPELEQKIPKSLEGYPVLVEETGVIRPLRKETGPA